jgi:hypothetical protein
MRFYVAAASVHGSAEAQRELNTYLGSRRMLGVEQPLVADGAQSVWAICVSYVDAPSHHAASHDPTRPLFTYEQRAEMVRRPVQTLAALAGIEGVGAVERSPGLRLSGAWTQSP